MTYKILLFILYIIKIINSLFRGDFIVAYKYVPALIYSYIFCYFQSFLESIFISIKETKTIMYSTVIGALVNIILNIVLINIWGIMGAVVSTGISYFIVYLIRYGRLYKSKRIMKYSDDLDLIINKSLEELIEYYKKHFFPFLKDKNVEYYNQYLNLKKCKNQ